MVGIHIPSLCGVPLPKMHPTARDRGATGHSVSVGSLLITLLAFNCDQIYEGQVQGYIMMIRVI